MVKSYKTFNNVLRQFFINKIRMWYIPVIYYCNINKEKQFLISTFLELLIVDHMEHVLVVQFLQASMQEFTIALTLRASEKKSQNHVRNIIIN
jgi:hypothetical protein